MAQEPPQIKVSLIKVVKIFLDTEARGLTGGREGLSH